MTWGRSPEAGHTRWLGKFSGVYLRCSCGALYLGALDEVAVTFCCLRCELAAKGVAVIDQVAEAVA